MQGRSSANFLWEKHWSHSIFSLRAFFAFWESTKFHVVTLKGNSVKKSAQEHSGRNKIECDRQERNSFAWISEQTVGARKFKGKSRLDQNASLNAYFLTRVVCMPSDYVNIGQLCRHSFAWHAMPVWLTRSDPNLCRYNAKKAAWTDQQIRNMQSWQKRARTQL